MMRRPILVCSVLVVAIACAHAGPRNPFQPRVVVSPVGDTVVAGFMQLRGEYECRVWLLYDNAGPAANGCTGVTGDTSWIVYQDTITHAVIAAGKNIAVPIDSLDAVAIRVENMLTIRFGIPDSCIPNAQTLRHWRWWRAGRYTVQSRIVDPTTVRPVKRGRVEQQAIPAEAVVCLTWVHEPLPPE
jgi:hypothetical protein